MFNAPIRVLIIEEGEIRDLEFGPEPLHQQDGRGLIELRPGELPMLGPDRLKGRTRLLRGRRGPETLFDLFVQALEGLFGRPFPVQGGLGREKRLAQALQAGGTADRKRSISFRAAILRSRVPGAPRFSPTLRSRWRSQARATGASQ